MSYLVQSAINLAYELHSSQRRKASIIPGAPYTSHLAGVASEVAANGGSPEAEAAAWLHDAIEDQGNDSRQLILDRCGRNVLFLVEECTEVGTGEKGQFKAPWRQRKEAYLEHIAHVSQEALLVSVADKLQSARELRRQVRIYGNEAYKEFVKRECATVVERKSAVLWFHRSLAIAFQARLNASDNPRIIGIQALIDDFVEIVDYLESR